MKRIFLRLKQPLRNERGEITFFACFFVVGIVMLISFLLLYASIRITCINIRNGAKMELNNLSGTIYADTYRSQRETNFEEYLNTLTPAVTMPTCWRLQWQAAWTPRFRFQRRITRFPTSVWSSM